MSTNEPKPSSWLLVSVIIAIVIFIFLGWKFFLSESEDKQELETINAPISKVNPLPVKINTNEALKDTDLNPPIPSSTIDRTVKLVEPELNTQVITPNLNESDSWVKAKLASIVWRKELLELMIDEDMIRRFVVFVDNFSQGNIAYSHSPFIKPATSFTSKETTLQQAEQQSWEIDESTHKRFSLYVDLIRSADSETLVSWYEELHPLVSQAYSELGYPDREFDQVLQSAITKVLDLEYPKESLELVRPSVMYEFKSPEIEGLDDADKLMLRIGKENLLIIKSVLIEINEKLNKNQ